MLDLGTEFLFANVMYIKIYDHLFVKNLYVGSSGNTRTFFLLYRFFMNMGSFDSFHFDM